MNRDGSFSGKGIFVGLDIGSTTVKAVVLNDNAEILFSCYRRHFSEIRVSVASMMRDAAACIGEGQWKIALTGSGAIALSSELSLPFVQEVVASTQSIRQRLPDTDIAIELGGEDAKLTFFTGGFDQRMNETCAGGTGAFIDQMAAFIRTDVAGLDAMASRYKTIYPIASRCGVFAKTDIMALLNQGCAWDDIAASIMQAVVNQTISGLARGRSIDGKVVFLGGPLAFLPSLRQRFVETLKLAPDHAVFPAHAEYFVALGAALHARERRNDDEFRSANHAPERLLHLLEETKAPGETNILPPLFADAVQRQEFNRRHGSENLSRFPLEEYEGDAWLGIDSGSTTIKATLIDGQGRLLYSSYGPNGGDPLASAVRILSEIYQRRKPGLEIRATAVTGYGSGLLAAGIGADIDEVETVAHYAGARFFLPKVSFILDIGGQDIKCMRIRGGTIDRIQLNEACSSGCGSFIEAFAQSLDIPLTEFVEAALQARNPVDLGTRCTVFMNSKVKQAQKDGANIGDIAAGLSYSVIRNACYKVIKMSSIEELGDHVVAQGGAFANDALLRALELQLGRPVMRPALSGLMGAFGAALIARQRGAAGGKSRLLEMAALERFVARAATVRCRHCTNSCLLTVTSFPDKRRFISGNRCERGAGDAPQNLPNLYDYKYRRLFDPYVPLPREEATRGVIGIPRVLNIYENYPLWFTMLSALGYRVELSSPSSKELYFKGHVTIPSQTVCYPAKLAHGHIIDLIERGVDSIFFPCLPLEHKEFTTQDGNYNCPVVIGYPELLAKNIGALQSANIAIVHPFLPLDENFLAKRLHDVPMFADIPAEKLERAVRKGFAEMEAFKMDVRRAGETAMKELRQAGRFGIVLAGHPYHIDPEVHHGIAELITSCGMGVLTEDAVAHLGADPGPLRVVDQWTYHSRLYRAGAFVAESNDLAVLQIVSFGCGLDAITADQLEEIVAVKGRLYAQIKIDEGANLGPARIRIRSLLAALKERRNTIPETSDLAIYRGSPPYTEAMRQTHTLLVPQLSPVHFQFLEAAMTAEGYKVAQLPVVDRHAVEMGLRHVNNDACFPAIVVIGQLLHAVRSGQYDPKRIALMISQTGGGCRATNYIGFLRKALADCGLEHVPVVSFNLDGRDRNPGFRITGRLLKRLIMAGLYGDVLMRMQNRLNPYEAEPGSVARLAEEWSQRIRDVIIHGGVMRFHTTMLSLIRAFDRVALRTTERKPRVGLVGEILLKYHPDANNHAVDIIEREGGEAVVSDIMDFVLYSLYDHVYNYRHLSGNWKPYAAGLAGIAFLEFCRWSMRFGLDRSRHFTSPTRFSELLHKAKSLTSLGHQTGEGWLLAAEMVELLESGASHVLCIQPFGCLPNHITGKGMLKELKQRFPDSTIAAIDYDPGASEVNQVNRIKLMMSMI